MKYIFKYCSTDGCTYECDIIIPFECDDIDKLIYDSICKLQESEYGCEIFGVHVTKDEIDNLEHYFIKLEDWFEKNKYEIIPEKDERNIRC